MREWTIGFLIIACFTAGAPPVSAQCNIFVRAGFVSPGGPPDGSSPQSAFPTIKEGARAATEPGDVVCVGPGLYEEGNVEFGGDGVGERPIEIRADPSGVSTGDAPGAVRVIPPSAPSPPRTGFLVAGRQYVVIDGFEISGFAAAGIQVRADGNRIGSAEVTLRNNVITASRIGIDLTASHGVVVEGNTTVGNAQTGISIMACIFEEPEGRCREISGGPVTPRVSNNRSGGNGAHGMLVHVADDAVIQNNVVYANVGDGIQLRDSIDAQVINNLVYANGLHGLSVGRVAAALRTVVLNNTLFANGDWAIEIGDQVGASPGAAVVNNIVWQNLKGIGVLREDLRPASVCGYLAGFNLLTLDSYGDDTPHNVFDRAADPLFVDPVGQDGVLGGERVDGAFIDRSADDDFRLRQVGDEAVSPAIDAGSVRTAELGLTGSTASDGRADGGVVDIGFHYDASLAQTVMFTPPFMPLYVRTSGSDGATGRAPSGAFKTIGRAASEAAAGVTVVVGPGRYGECNLKPAGRNVGLAAFLADPTGDQTGDAAGPVIVDAAQCADEESERGETGFDISSSCAVVIDGFHVTGASEDGIRIDDNCDGAELRNNVVFGNGQPDRAGGRGIRVVDSLNVRIVNNLVHGNNAGIALGGRQCPDTGSCDSGSRKAVIEFNTLWDHMFNGIQVGDGLGVSSHATVRYNVTGQNQKNGIEVGDDDRRRENLQGFKSYRNLVSDSYGAGVQGADDLRLQPTATLYVDPSAIDLTNSWIDDQHFRLRQEVAGEEPSRAVDYADITALVAGMSARSTRIDSEPDAGNADLGYHYPRRGALTGDCDGDGAVRINELVMAVNIALGSVEMAQCPAVDADGSGMAEINELIGAVANALRS